MYCQKCGKATDAVVVPQEQQSATLARHTNSLAVAGFILTLLPFIPLPFLGLIFCIISRKQCIKRGEKGEKLAKAGIIIESIYGAIVVATGLIPLILFDGVL